MKLPQIILAILVLAFVGQIFYFYPQLPETIASHFDANGQANSFMSKNSFFVVEAVVLGGLLALLFSLAKLLPKIPISAVKLPNKEHWLSPERRAGTYATLGRFFIWLGALITALFIAINQTALTAGLNNRALNPAQFWISMGLFFAFLVILVFVHFRGFLGQKSA